eukprot:COSAG01_NODE_16696_length_1214_cov_0.736323_3_plen_179_part_00
MLNYDVEQVPSPPHDEGPDRKIPELAENCLAAWVCSVVTVTFVTNMAWHDGMVPQVPRLEHAGDRPARDAGGRAVASFWAAVLTEIYLCNVCSCPEILIARGVSAGGRGLVRAPGQGQGAALVERRLSAADAAPGCGGEPDPVQPHDHRGGAALGLGACQDSVTTGAGGDHGIDDHKN